MEFADQLQALKDREPGPHPYTIARIESDARLGYYALTLDFADFSAQFSTDRDGRVLVDLANAANAATWVNSVDLTTLISGDKRGFHAASLLGAFDALQAYLHAHGDRVRRLLSGAEYERTLAQTDAISIRQLEHDVGVPPGSLVRPPRV